MAKKSRKLMLEALEDRLTPTQWGVAWPNPGHLTLSLVPDGTSVGSGLSSNLFQTLNANAPTANWEEEILRAFQTWAVNANLNIGVVADGGQALGASGAVQGDPRFGDIRVAMAPLPSTTSLANTSGFDLSGSTWGGDMLLNSNYNFGVNGQGQYDLFTVALHEASHSLGIGDQTTDPTSATYAIYTGPRSGLSAADIAALQSIYGGPRSPDLQGNNSLANALSLSQPGQNVSADISSATDTQFYSFTAPASSGLLGGGTTSFTVQVNAAGTSLLEPVVTVYDASGNVVGSGAASDPLNNNVSVQISNAQPGASYYVQVAGASGSVFGIGGYQMTIQTAGAVPAASAASSSPTQVLNTSFATAQALSSIQVDVNSQGYTYLSSGAISTLTPQNYYKVVAPTLPVQGSEMLTVTASSTDASGLNSYVRVYDAWHNLLPSTVINNGNGTFTVQLTGITAGMSYYIQVSALAGTAQNVGAFALAAEFNNDAATTFTQLANATLTQSQIIGYQSMSVANSQMVEFSLAASANSWWVNSAVRMTVYDQNNNAVFTMVAFAGQPLSTSFVFLQSGSYTIRYNAATQTGAPLPTITTTLSTRVLSDPMNPVPIDPTLSGTGGTGISIGTSTGGGVGTLPLISPYSNPITNPPAVAPATLSLS